MLTLRAGESSLVLAPEIGGAIVGWTLGSVPLMRRPQPDAIISGDVRGLACFPLVPFSNRIAYARFHWDRVDYALNRNFGDHPHAIHGVGWQRAWTVDAVGPASATLTLRHDATGEQARSWPFAFSAEQRFTLTADALHVVLTLRNLHPSPAPAGLGLHPYFPRSGAATLRFTAGRVWRNADMLPSEAVQVPREWDHSQGLRIGMVSLDNCFAGWTGEARIAWAPGGPTLSVEADEPFRHLVVYTPPDRDFFCVEPVSHMNDAINRMATVSGHGLHILGPGEALRGKITFRIASIRQRSDA
jgi:aldose 1-epimerase